MFYYAVDFNQDISKWGWRGGMAHKQQQPGMFQGAIRVQRRFNCPNAITAAVVHQCQRKRRVEAAGELQQEEGWRFERRRRKLSEGGRWGLSKPRPASGELGHTKSRTKTWKRF